MNLIRKTIKWESDGRFRVGRVRFRAGSAGTSSDQVFHIRKTPEMIRYYERLAAGLRGARIFELGLAEGGSCALLALLASPTKIVSVELSPDPIQALSSFIARRRLGDVVSAHYGVDQADRAELSRIYESEFRGAPLDLVIDDASHMLEPTRVSFDLLFPRLRPGGRYIIEDWNAAQTWQAGVLAAQRDPTNPYHQAAVDWLASVARDGIQGDSSRRWAGDTLSRIGVELMLACNRQNDLVDSVSFNDWCIEVTRGSAPCPAEGFSLTDCYVDTLGLLGD